MLSVPVDQYNSSGTLLHELSETLDQKRIFPFTSEKFLSCLSKYYSICLAVFDISKILLSIA